MWTVDSPQLNANIITMEPPALPPEEITSPSPSPQHPAAPHAPDIDEALHLTSESAQYPPLSQSQPTHPTQPEEARPKPRRRVCRPPTAVNMSDDAARPASDPPDVYEPLTAPAIRSRCVAHAAPRCASCSASASASDAAASPTMPHALVTPVSDSISPRASDASDAVSDSASEDDASCEHASNSHAFTVSSTNTYIPAYPPSSCVSTHVGDRLPRRLATALAAIDCELPPYYDWQRDFPNPGLVVVGLPEPLALPLVPSQAAQLATLAAVSTKDGALEVDGDPGVAECVQIEPEMLRFENPDWDDAMDELFRDVCFYLGLRKDNVKRELHGLVLYHSAGHSKPQVNPNTKKSDAIFATVTVQLPSYFSGGEVIIRYNGQEEEVTSGADDGTNRFKSFYTVCFVDVEQESRPIKEGYRLTLVFNLLWIGKGCAPAAKTEDLAEVAAALQEHADKSAVGDWYLAFMLEHEYTPESLSDYGTGALERVDRRNVGTLSVAAEMLGIGELDFVLCRLSRKVTMYGKSGVIPFEFKSVCSFIDTDGVSVSEAYWHNGKAYEGDLDWVGWDFASFTEEEKEKEQNVPGSTDSTKITTWYRALAVVVFARSMEVEALVRGPTYDVRWFLNDEDLSDPSDARADRMLGCIERGCPYGGYDDIPWERTWDILEFCLERGLHEQASRGIRIASLFHVTEGIAQVLFQYVLRYGWEVIGEALEEYLCSPTIPKSFSIVGRLQTLFQLMPWMSARTALGALTMAVTFVERHKCKRFERCRGGGGCELRRHNRKIWVTLMSVIAELELKSSETEIRSTVDDLAVRLTTVMEELDESQIEPIYQALKYGVIEKPSKHLTMLLARSRRISVERYERMAKFLTVHKTSFPLDYVTTDSWVSTDFFWDDNEHRSDERLEKDWVKYISLSREVLSAKDLHEGTSKLVEELTDIIALLSKRNIDVLEKVISGLDYGSEEEESFSLVEDKIREARRSICERSTNSGEVESDGGSSGSDYEGE